MDYLSVFKMPVPMKITGRSSSITNAFVSSIIPNISPTADQVKEALHILGIAPSKVTCCYCGEKSTEWDHLRPLVKKRKPTGYISEIHNLVPSCGKCNQSKGNKYWKDWITSSAKWSPKSRAVADLDKRIKRLERYEKWGKPTMLEIEKVIERTMWEKHWRNLDNFQSLMQKSQILAEEIRKALANNLRLARQVHFR